MAWAGSKKIIKTKKLLRQVRILRKVGNKSTKIDGAMKKMKKSLHRKMLRTCGRDSGVCDKESGMKGKLMPVHLVFLLLGVFYFVSDTGAISLADNKYEKLKITRFQASGEFVWCGAKHLVLSTGKNAGIRLLNIGSGQIRQVTTVKTHRAVSCTPDGRHIFFADNMVEGEMNEFDAVTGKQQAVYSKNKASHKRIEEAPISPSGEYLLGPSTLSEQVKLSDRTLKGLRIPNTLSGETINAIAWAEDGTLSVTFGEYTAKKLLIQPPKNAKARVINLPNFTKAGSLFRSIAWLDRTKHLYLLAWDGSEEKGEWTDLYEIEPEKLPLSPRLIVTDVDEFKLRPNGSLVYTKTVGVSIGSKAGSVTYDEKTAHESLSLRTTRGNVTELLRFPYRTLSIRNIQISPSGDAIAVGIVKIEGNNDLTEIQILHIGANN